MPHKHQSEDDQAFWDAPTNPTLRAIADPSRVPPLPPTQRPTPYPAAYAPPTIPLRTPEHPRPANPLYPGVPHPARRKGRRLATSALLVLLVVLVVAAGAGAHRLYDFGRAISNQPPLSTQTGFMSGAGRVNVLVLGYGGTGHDGPYLTDSLMVMSLVPADGATTMISVPRDLWVQVPPDSGQYAKINAAYANGLYNGYGGLPAGRLAGGAEAASKVSEVLGITVSYWMTIDFTGFRKLVDALGGVDINVPTAFTAQYPRNDDPRIDAGWKTIHFRVGPQHMNGEQAIEYARARYVLSPASEGTDFARSARQQLLIRAILSRARQVSAWPGLLNGINALQSTIYTNLSLADLLLFTEKLDFNHATRIGLSNDNVLVGTQSSDGQDILLPAGGDWNAIRQYVADRLKG